MSRGFLSGGLCPGGFCPRTVKKAFDNVWHNVWHNGLRYKIFQLELPTKMTRWLSDFLVGRIIQVNVNSFFPPKSTLKQGFHRVLS